jgi:hypothetical protein
MYFAIELIPQLFQLREEQTPDARGTLDVLSPARLTCSGERSCLVFARNMRKQFNKFHLLANHI